MKKVLVVVVIKLMNGNKNVKSIQEHKIQLAYLDFVYNPLS